MIDRDDWSERELQDAEAYAITCSNVISHILGKLAAVEVALSEEKRAAVEVAALLEAAVHLAQDKLQLNADDFATTACELYMRMSRP
ncbi:hypothetical protein I6F35_02840 [Bradyrhizobium sp. BRP22]|uniref:hypothetical protein n=1 Tax=Bradyrhizobium sp. BRP22 TaxID=2793821 RepID=UPI001CD22483|nr:hypothetical protein [Bradyrhizobium sp. BRP22]MCA1452151.1 hypothetical protein [Bradyrhizobium sp. BRP22]